MLRDPAQALHGLWADAHNVAAERYPVPRPLIVQDRFQRLASWRECPTVSTASLGTSGFQEVWLGVRSDILDGTLEDDPAPVARDIVQGP